jgi:molybdenum ABC transporter molybdate-binding protein
MILSIGPKFKLILVFSLLIQACKSDRAVINIAVASNFEPFITEIIKKYKNKFKTTYELNIISGSSGQLTSQILNGAPFDLFLSADEDKPLKIYNELTKNSLPPTVYAIGKLSLWIPNGVKNSDCSNQLNNIKSLAIANPEIAPYGKLASKLITKLNIQTPKIVTTSNVNQAFLYTKETYTEAGFVPYSSLILHQVKSGCIEVFNSLELKQSMILLNPSAKSFYDYILSEDIQKYILESGYNIDSTH